VVLVEKMNLYEKWIETIIAVPPKLRKLAKYSHA